MGQPSRRDEFPLNPQISLQVFEKWVIDFIGPVQPLGKNTGVRYIITAIEYLTIWMEAHRVRDYIATTAAKFLFKYVLTRFG